MEIIGSKVHTYLPLGPLHRSVVSIVGLGIVAPSPDHSPLAYLLSAPFFLVGGPSELRPLPVLQWSLLVPVLVLMFLWGSGIAPLVPTVTLDLVTCAGFLAPCILPIPTKNKAKPLSG